VPGKQANRKLAHPHFLIDRAFAPYYHSSQGYVWIGSHRLPFLFLCRFLDLSTSFRPIFVLIREAMLHNSGAIVNSKESTLTQWLTKY